MKSANRYRQRAIFHAIFFATAGPALSHRLHLLGIPVDRASDRRSGKKYR
jgi:hypothetical protein